MLVTTCYCGARGVSSSVRASDATAVQVSQSSQGFNFDGSIESAARARELLFAA